MNEILIQLPKLLTSVFESSTFYESLQCWHYTVLSGPNSNPHVIIFTIHSTKLVSASTELYTLISKQNNCLYIACIYFQVDLKLHKIHGNLSRLRSSLSWNRYDLTWLRHVLTNIGTIRSTSYILIPLICTGIVTKHTFCNTPSRSSPEIAGCVGKTLIPNGQLNKL